MKDELIDYTSVKVFLTPLLVILLGICSAKAETLDTNLPITAGSLTYNSVTISTALSAPVFSGMYRSKIMLQKQGDSTWISGDTVLVSDTADIITSSVYGLASVTTYVNVFRLRWLGAVRDTIRGGVTQFTTVSAPRHPTTTILNIIPGVPTSKMIIKRDGDQFPSAGVVRTGSSYQFQFPITIGSGVRVDTIDLNTSNPNETVSYYVKLLRNDALGLRDTIVAYGSFVTPALTSAKITSTSVLSGTDSVFISALITRGTQIGSVQFTLKDSTGVPIEASTAQSIIVSGEYRYSSRSVLPGLLYLLQVKVWDPLGLDTITKSIRTKSIPLPPGGERPDIVFDIIGMRDSPSPVLSISGYDGLDATTTYLKVEDTVINVVVLDTVINTGMFDRTKEYPMPNFPNGKYRVTVYTKNRFGSSNLKTKRYSRDVTVTAIINRRPDGLDPETEITAIDLLGREEIAGGKWSQYYDWMPMLKPVMLLADIDGTRYKWKAMRTN